MRSPYEDTSAIGAVNKYQYNGNANNNNNNNNNYYKNYNTIGNGNGSGNGIPYHARENSLPFSYGIAKTSTPLRKTPTPTQADCFLDFDFGTTTTTTTNNYNYKNDNNNSNNGNINDMIKPQPRLTSPLLVRKTLGNGTNTTNSTNTNTIANTYHYRSGLPSSASSATSASSPQQTPLRDDFEQLLRERREKVFNEYRGSEGVGRQQKREPPIPPQRQYYTNTLYTTNGNGNGNGYYRNTSSLGGKSKYNYDFEFNLNLDDLDYGNNERKSAPAPTYAPYQTRTIQFVEDQDVPDGVINRRHIASTLEERNYHTINSSSSKINSSSINSQQQLHVEPASSTYGQSNSSNLETLTRTRRDLSASPSSPIYATSSKRNPNTNGQTTTPSPTSRPETPAFPVTPRTPFGGTTPQQQHLGLESIYQTTSRQNQRQSTPLGSPQEPPMEVAADSVRFARSSAKFWYKANLSREDAIALLASAQPGTFLVRDSTTYKNAYGLVVRVSQPPAGSQELVRHFLIEPTQRGVRLKGCANEPVFTSLSALVFEHSINQLALPCLLRLPEEDIVPSPLAKTPAQEHLLAHGAACNVLWLYSCDTESLTGNEAIRKAIRQMYAQTPLHPATEVHFKVTSQGITLTDNTRKKFFRKHYTADIISHCAIDPENRMWSSPPSGEDASKAQSEKKTIFAFVARRSHSSKDNQCHVFCDLSVSQPAAAIVSFANRTLPTEKLKNYVL
ncbi:uncharacterized protein Dwil_GK13836 [Drosophila willistoni]|uniref:SH2 domain-containing protein n=1 Tax=Drosophila willistoni TaxID=7260 RepID=B4NJ67_DROWI|nr:tensin [Drosophila willistoni]EDW83860.1 uncharacterized protein Dwil_GK13836 [Drosophila willistoni]